MAGEKDTDEEPEVAPSDRGRSDAEARVRPVHEIWERPREVQPEPVRTEPVVSVNVLCLLGAIVGVVSLFLPWCIVVDGPNEFGVSPASLVMDDYRAPSDPLLFSSLVFISGTVIAFLFPVAFAAQSVGILLFLLQFVDAVLHPALSLGFYAGVLSSVMVLAGLIHPVGPGYDHRWPWWSRRTEVPSRAEFLEGRLVNQRLAKPGEMARALKGGGSRTYAAVIAISLIAGAFLVGLQMHLTPDQVVTMDDGVSLIVGDAAPFVTWDEAQLTLSDGSATVTWTGHSVRWVDGHRTKECELPTAYFGAQDLSGLALGLTVVDVAGEGYVTHGDMIFLMPSGGASFADGIPYRLTIGHPYRSGVLIDPPVMWYYGTITFEFEGGEVTSSSTDRVLGYSWDDGFALASWVFVVACFAVMSGAAYYVPVRAIRRRVLDGRSQGTGACDGSEGR